MGKQWKRTDFIFLGSKITVNRDCSREINFLLGRKAMSNLDSVLKSRDITLPTKVRIDKAMVFPAVMCGCESWTIKKAEHHKELMPSNCGAGKDSRVPWNARRSNQSILKEINPEYSFRRNTLSTWCEEPTHWKRPKRCWERLKAGGEGDDRGWDVWMTSPTRWTWV